MEKNQRSVDKTAETQVLYTLNVSGILLYLRHSFSYIFFNPLFSEKQPFTYVSGLFIFQELVYDSLWLFVYNQIFLRSYHHEYFSKVYPIL